MYDRKDTPQQVAERFGLPLAWAQMHQGRHRCVDGRNYIYSCLVTDPDCDHEARNYMADARRTQV